VHLYSPLSIYNCSLNLDLDARWGSGSRLAPERMQFTHKPITLLITIDVDPHTLHLAIKTTNPCTLIVIVLNRVLLLDLYRG